MDVNTKKLKKNAFRVTKERGLTASRVRIPGGHLEVKYLGGIQEIAEKYGNGTIHITSRQGFEIPGIPYEKMEEVNAALQEIISGLEINQETENAGYPAAGTRNIAACIGNRVCPYACFDTTTMANRIEKAVFPDDLHFKIAITGCPNDCNKVRMHDFGIMGMTLPQFEADRCISCGACVKMCTKKSTGALTLVNFRPQRDHQRCIGCGECVINCPNMAWTRSTEKYYRLTLMGRSGKRNPRFGEDFLKWTDEDSIVKIICNTYDYVREYIDTNAVGGKEHIGYIVDRTGFEEFKKWMMKDVKLPEITEMADTIYWGGIKY